MWRFLLRGAINNLRSWPPWEAPGRSRALSGTRGSPWSCWCSALCTWNTCTPSGGRATCKTTNGQRIAADGHGKWKREPTGSPWSWLRWPRSRRTDQARSAWPWSCPTWARAPSWRWTRARRTRSASRTWRRVPRTLRTRGPPPRPSWPSRNSSSDRICKMERDDSPNCHWQLWQRLYAGTTFERVERAERGEHMSTYSNPPSLKKEHPPEKPKRRGRRLVRLSRRPRPADCRLAVRRSTCRRALSSQIAPYRTPR